ncbi:MAG: RluA family pseudouridine synthase, partial [Gemmataceae bacterium]|nr:RluA family pseudouridine synthase [Gemmataceae bacterium]
MPPIVFVVDRRENGRTLAAVLKQRFGISWSQAKRLVEKRHVRVGQQVETDVARRLKVGKTVLLDAGTIEQKGSKAAPKAPVSRDPKRSAGERAKPAAKSNAQPAPRKRAPVPDVEIVYSDDAVVVANKPAGLTTMRHKEEAEEFGPRGKHYLPTTL